MDSTMLNVILVGIVETFEMVIVSTVLGYVLGLPLGIILTITDKNGLKPNAVVYKILDAVTNILRSVPFLILLVVIIPFTKLLVGKSYGTSGAIVPLTISAFPFIARMVESSLKEVDPGVIEAAQSMGATTWQIVKNVLLVEARTSLITGATIVFATIIGYSAMAGVVGAGGLGDIAVRYGYYRREEVPMWISVILLVILVEIFQNLGNFIAKRVDKSSNKKNMWE